MNKFLLVHLKSEWARNNFVDKLAKSYEGAIQFKIKLTAVHQLSASKILVSLQADDFFGFGRGYFIENRKATVLDGFPLPNGKALKSGAVAQELQSWISATGDVNTVFDRLRGEYSVATYAPNTDEITAFSDYTGLKPLYYIQNDDFSAVSNRQFLLNPICTKYTKPSFDLMQAASLISQGNKFGEKSIFSDVNLLLPGHFLKITEFGEIRVEAFTHKLWDERRPPNHEDYDAACDTLVQNFNWIQGVPALNDKPIRLSLTGGEDSRLVLAMGLNSNISNRITTFTYGQEDNPDIKVAEIVAKAAKVPHEKKIFAPQASGPIDIDGYWQGLSKHAFRFEGATGAWDGGWAKATQMNFDITGFSDFFFKRIRPSNAAVDIQSKLDAIDHFQSFQQAYDPLNIVRKYPRGLETYQIKSWIDSKLDAGASLNELPELYYQDNRFTWWSGALNSNVLTQVRVSPMSSKLAASIGLKQSLVDRRERKFIFEMMLRLAPQLLETPYLNKQWPEHFGRLAPHIKLPTTQFKFESAPNSALPWQILLAKHGNKRIKEYLLMNEQTGIFDLVDKERIIKVLDDVSNLNNTPAIRSIINLTELMILLTGEWTIDRDDIKEHQVLNPGIETNIPEFRKILETKSTAVSSFGEKQVRRSFEINLPAQVIHNIRIDPMDKPGQATLHKAYIQDNKQNTIVTIPLVKNIYPNSQLKIASTTADNGLLLLSSGDDPHIAFNKSLFVDLQLPGQAKLVVEITLPERGLFEVYYDMGSGFDRTNMYSKRF